jgi:hypothetical protein
VDTRLSDKEKQAQLSSNRRSFTVRTSPESGGPRRAKRRSITKRWVFFIARRTPEGQSGAKNKGAKRTTVRGELRSRRYK